MRNALRRAPQYILVLFAALSLNFLLPRLAPGDPLEYLMGPEAYRLTGERRTEVLASFSLDQPVHVQFGQYLEGLAHADLGTSVRFREPVTDVIADRLPHTLLLVGSSVVISSIVGAALGVRAARRRGRRRDVGTLLAVTLLDSLPVFWLGMVLLGVFAVELGWLPMFGASAFADSSMLSLDRLKHLVLPASTLVLSSLGGIFLVTRYSVVATLQEDFMLMAEASGLSSRRVALRAFRNSLLPVTTVVMINVGYLLGGAVVIETVFAYPGVGRLMFDGVAARDYPLLQGTFLLVTLGVLIANLVSDLLYPVLDPRVRRTGALGALPGR